MTETPKTRVVPDVTGYFIREDERGNPAAPRWFQMTDGRFHAVTPPIADWICRAWEHNADATAYEAARGALDARIEQHNQMDADLERRANELEQRGKLAINGKRGWWNPLSMLDIPQDWRDFKQVQAEAPELIAEAEQMSAVADHLNARSVDLDAWADRINARLCAMTNEAALLGGVPIPQAYPHFAYAMIGRSPQQLTTPPELPSLTTGTPAPIYQAPVAAPVYHAPPEPQYVIPAYAGQSPQPYGTSPTSQPAQPYAPPPAAAPNPSSSNVFDDLI